LYRLSTPIAARDDSKTQQAEKKWKTRCGELCEKDAAKLQVRRKEELEIAKKRAESRAAERQRTILLEARSKKAWIVPCQKRELV
jgi:hypothetical protein